MISLYVMQNNVRVQLILVWDIMGIKANLALLQDKHGDMI